MYKKSLLKKSLHNCDNLSETQKNAIHLGDEYAGHSDEKRGTVHVNIATDWQDESGDSRVDSELLGHQTKSHRKCSSPVQSCVSKDWVRHASDDSRKIYSMSPVAAVDGHSGVNLRNSGMIYR